MSHEGRLGRAVGAFLALAVLAPSLANGQTAFQHREIPDDPWVPTPPQPEGHGAGETEPPTVGPFQSVQVNVDRKRRNIAGDAANEPSLAVDPFAPNRMVIGWRQFDSVTSNFRQAGWAYSRDGGRSWTFAGRIEPGVFRSDPVLDVDAGGNFYYASLRGDFGVDIFKSSDGGESWGPPIPAFGGDKEWMVVDRSGGAGDGNVYLSWSACGGGVNAGSTRSTDGGATFERPVPQPAWTGTLAVGGDGALYIVGAPDPGGCEVEFALLVGKSTTAQDPRTPLGWDFLQEVDLGGPHTVGRFLTPNPGGLLYQPWIAVDPTDPEVVYIVSGVDPAGADPLDVHFLRSSDGGITWSAPVRVNDDLPETSAFQWFSTLSVAPNGRLDVIFNDTRNDQDPASPATSELFYSFSEDGGRTWSPNVAVSPPFEHSLGYPQQNKLGDYYHMVSDDLGAHVAYAATFNGEQDVFYLRIGSYDCNQNGIGDEDDLASGTSEDANENGIPDECDAAALRSALVADFSFPETIVEETEFSFDARGSRTAEELSIVAYHWDFGDGTEAAGVSPPHAYQELGEYRVRLRVEDELGRRARSRRTVRVAFRSEDVEPWTAQDIGTVAVPGGARHEGECLRVAGSGTFGGFFHRADTFHYVHQRAPEAFRLTARIAQTEEFLPADLGLMLRETLDPNARHAAVVLTRQKDAFRHRFLHRTEQGGARQEAAHSGALESPAVWLRLERSGDQVSAALSQDGVTWTEPDGIELPGLANEVFAGIASTCPAFSPERRPCTATLCDLQLELLTPPLTFRRGDCNDDGTADISDAVCILDWLFLGGDTPACVAVTNTNGDAESDISDATYLLNHLFLGGPALIAPYPDCAPGTLPTDEETCETPPESCES